MMKSYSELILLPTFEERFEYLKTTKNVGELTFGVYRYLNQALYSTVFWKQDIRNKVILRDSGCDMGLKGYEIFGPIYIHHINPITVEDFMNRDPKIIDLNNLICVSYETHNAIHYGDINSTIMMPKERSKYDTCPWRH